MTSIPKLFEERLSTIFSPDVQSQIIKCLNSQRVTSIRINTLKSSVNEITEAFTKKNIKFEKIPWYSDALIILNATSRVLTELEDYKKGHFYIQSLSSMIPALVLNPKEDEKILDLAAAPGSKTTQLAALMNNTGEIIANDPSKNRLFKLKQNLETQGVNNTTITSFDGQSFWQKYPEYFDKTLVDVPCSMEGTITEKNRDSFFDEGGYWSVKKIKQLSKMQRWLLRSAISSTKPGGTIVYSTCTLSPEENEMVIDWILEKEKDKISLDTIEIKGLTSYPSLTEYKGKTLNPELSKTLRILPSDTMEGFFVAKIRKTNI